MRYSMSVLPDILRTEGINCLGSGPAAKLVALDPKLSLEAKAIYALICSYSGSGNREFPCVQNMAGMLGLGINRYYKHLRPLTERGYIKVTQQMDKTRFTRNVYTLVMDPPCIGEVTENEEDHALVKAEGLLAKGFGIVAKAVMADRRLSCRAKGLYFFYCAFAGGGNSALPSREQVEYFLGISKNSLTKYKKELLDLGYIEDRQRTVAGKFSGSDLVIVQRPLAAGKGTGERFLPCPKNRDTDGGKFSAEQEDISLPCPKNEETEALPCPNFSCRKNGETRKTELRNTDTFNSFSPAKTLFTTGEERGETEKKVQALTGWYRQEGDLVHNGNLWLFNEALTDLLCAKEGTTVLNTVVTAKDAAEKLESFLEKDGEEDTVILYDLVVNTLIDFEHGCRISAVKNRLKYMQACLWTCMKLRNSRLIDTLSTAI